MAKKSLRDGAGVASTEGVATAASNEKAAHTPGPWSLIGTELKRTEHDEPYAVIQTRRGLAIDIIAPGAMADEHMANARVMAAAPDLVAALKAMVALYDNGTRNIVGASVLAKLAAADAAINKAEGRA